MGQHHHIRPVHRLIVQQMAENIADVNLLVQPYLDDDLKLISKWIKDDLFEICKFVYNKKDLEGPEGKIHILFEKQCKERLSGWKATNDAMKQQFYAKIVFEAAKKIVYLHQA